MATRSSSERYRLSFTSGVLFLQSAPLASKLFGELGDWAMVRDSIDASNLMQARTASSGRRQGRELVQRLQELSEVELDLLIDATADERAQLMWVATCRRYELIAEFAEEVLRERFLLMAPDISAEHFDAFVRGKMLWHPEVAELEESTLRKLRTTLFQMLQQAGLVTVDGIIVPTLLSARVREELEKRNPSDVRLFPTREAA